MGTESVPSPPEPSPAHPSDTASRTLLGAVEVVDFPTWGIAGLRAKIDTGARSSALHVSNVEELGEGKIRFDVVLDTDHTPRRVQVETFITRKGRVRSSNGKAGVRYFVMTVMRLGRLRKSIEISLAERADLRYRMLLGRSAMGKDVWVDPSRRYIASKRKGEVALKPSSQ